MDRRGYGRSERVERAEVIPVKRVMTNDGNQLPHENPTDSASTVLVRGQLTRWRFFFFTFFFLKQTMRNSTSSATRVLTIVSLVILCTLSFAVVYGTQNIVDTPPQDSLFSFHKPDVPHHRRAIHHLRAQSSNSLSLTPSPTPSPTPSDTQSSSLKSKSSSPTPVSSPTSLTPASPSSDSSTSSSKSSSTPKPSDTTTSTTTSTSSTSTSSSTPS